MHQERLGRGLRGGPAQNMARRHLQVKFHIGLVEFKGHSSSKLCMHPMVCLILQLSESEEQLSNRQSVYAWHARIVGI